MNLAAIEKLTSALSQVTTLRIIDFGDLGDPYIKLYYVCRVVVHLHLLIYGVTQVDMGSIYTGPNRRL